MQYIYTVGFNLAAKEKKIMKLACKWRDGGTLLLWKINHSQKDKCCIRVFQLRIFKLEDVTSKNRKWKGMMAEGHEEGPLQVGRKRHRPKERRGGGGSEV